MEEQNFSSQRRQEILEHLRKEREKRREELESEEYESSSGVTHSFRSETIARLVQERRNQDILQLSKANLQENLKEEKDFRFDAPSLESSDLSSPQTWRFLDESEVVQSFEPEKPKKREIQKPKSNKQPPPKSKPYSARVNSKDPEPSKTPKSPNIPKQSPHVQDKIPVRLKSKKSLSTLSKASVQSVPTKDPKPLTSISTSEKDLRRESFEKRIDDLVKSKEASLKQREQQKKQKDEEEMKKCSFTPQVTPYYTKHTISEKIEDRLLKLGQEHQKNKEKLIKEKEIQETSNSNFIPKISEGSSNLIKNYQPIHERLEDLQKERQEIINKLRSNIESKAEGNFKPKINSHIIKPAQNRSVSIENQSKDNFTSKRRVQDDLLQNEIENFTFTPQTASKPGDLKGFLNRQEEFLKKKEQKIQQKFSAEDTCTFKPIINSNSRCIALETEGEDKFERMSKQELEKRQQKQAKIQEEYYGKFSYEPKINPTSKLICRNSSVYESKTIPIIEETDSCSFKPKLESKKFKNVESHYSNPQAIMEKIKEKEQKKQEKIKEIKENVEQKISKNCTFQPKIVEHCENKETVLVPGLDKFLAWKELSKKQEEEKKAREFKVFGIKNNTSSITVPQPFNLAANKKEQNLEKIKQGVDEQFYKACTFKPKTLESANMKVINKIMMTGN